MTFRSKHKRFIFVLSKETCKMYFSKKDLKLRLGIILWEIPIKFKSLCLLGFITHEAKPIKSLLLWRRGPVDGMCKSQAFIHHLCKGMFDLIRFDFFTVNKEAI